jgi:hypothetical protein
MELPPIAYIADGRLFMLAAGSDARLVESTFVQGILDRVEKNRERNEWKGANMAWQVTRRMNPMALGAQLGELRRVRFAGVAAGPSANEILYAIDTDYACGLFQHELREGYERRLYHRNQFRACDLARSSETGMLAFALRSPDGTSHVATMAAEGRGFKTITEGDAVDEAPSWVPGGGNVVLFQSAGVGRNPHGAVTGLSPYAIQKIDLDQGKMEMVVEEDDTDALMPRQAKDGSLYFVRRPYQPLGAAIPFWRYALDTALFPFRLLVAIAGFLNVFSMIFAKKPLMTAGGPEREGPDQRILMLYGQLIDARKQSKASASRDGELVPATWVLVRKKPDGSESILAKNVVSYDLCADGGFVYTTGSNIYHVSADGNSTKVGKGQLIERVTVLAE